jgi:hypothetical protein
MLAAAVAMIDSALPEIMHGATDEDGWPVVALETVAAALARHAGVQSGQTYRLSHRIGGCQGGGGAERTKPLIRVPPSNRRLCLCETLRWVCGGQSRRGHGTACGAFCSTLHQVGDFRAPDLFLLGRQLMLGQEPPIHALGGINRN